MVASGSVSEFSERSKNEVEQTFVSCAAPEALTVPPVLREQRRRRGSAPLGFLLHSENSLTEPEATILALGTP